MSCHLVWEGSVLVFVRQATTRADAARLDQEASILARVAHPGVVALAPGVAAGAGRLRTRAVRGRPLAVMDDLEAPEVAGLSAVVATTVADLHDVGVVHGAIDADRILVTAEGMTVLTGFADATVTSPPAGREAGADVAALVRTLGELPGADDGLRRALSRAAGRRRGARDVARALAQRRDIRLPARSPLVGRSTISP